MYSRPVTVSGAPTVTGPSGALAGATLGIEDGVVVSTVPEASADGTYTVALAEGAVVDSQGTAAPAASIAINGLAPPAPVLGTSGPSDSVTAHTQFGPEATVVFTFSDPVKPGSGTITLTPSVDPSAVIYVAGSDVRIRGIGRYIVFAPERGDLSAGEVYTTALSAGLARSVVGVPASDAPSCRSRLWCSTST